MTERPPHTRDPNEVTALQARVAQVRTGPPEAEVDMAAIRRSVFRILFAGRFG
jgi:hypothetical protein